MKKVYLFAAALIFGTMVMTSCGGETTPATEPEVAQEATPAETVAPAEEAPVAVLGDAVKGEEVYKQVCMACHDAGIAGAAKLTDKARWETSAAQGFETVKKHTIEGYTGANGVMPPKGGRVDLTDEDMVNAITYIFQTAGVEIK
ncbi:MAG: cytochrome c5 family protein [Bacteroidales bacterium]|nr:cytochrome c5 family protein [Bacteroidales bacterium]